MRVPVQAPALVRNQRGQPVRRSGGGRIEGYGVTPSQYEGGDDEGEGGEDEGGESGEDGGNEAEADSSVESEG
jgi:hypothetical protein